MRDQRSSATLGVIGLLLVGVASAPLAGCDTGRDAAHEGDAAQPGDGGVASCDAYGPFSGGPPWAADASTSRIAHWDGTEWSLVQSGTPGRLDTVSGSGPDDAWAFGQHGPALRWDGAAWSDASSLGLVGACSVWSAGPDDAWAVWASSGVFHWDRSSWTHVDIPGVAGFFEKVNGRSTDDVWLLQTNVGPVIKAARYLAGTWAPVDSAWDGTPTDIWPSGPDDVWIVGYTADTTVPPWTPLVHWDGTSWTNFTISETQWMFFYSLWGSAPDDVWAAGSLKGSPPGAMLIRWNGTSWTRVDPPAGVAFCSPIWGTASDDVWLACMGRCYDAFFIFHWDGASWMKTATLDWYPESIWGSGRDDVWLVGFGGPS